LDQDKILYVLNQYIELIKQHMSPQKIILYGSYAKGIARDNSDIYIAVIVDEIKGDYSDQIFILYKLRRDIDDRIEPVLLEIGHDPSGFVKEVLKTGKVLYDAA
jgi:predicted nucleotidyltransferase